MCCYTGNNDDNLHAVYTILSKVLTIILDTQLHNILHNGKNLRMMLPEEDFGTQIQHMVFGKPSFFTEYKQLATDHHPFFRGI